MHQQTCSSHWEKWWLLSAQAKKIEEQASPSWFNPLDTLRLLPAQMTPHNIDLCHNLPYCRVAKSLLTVQAIKNFASLQLDTGVQIEHTLTPIPLLNVPSVQGMHHLTEINPVLLL
jgi:hypothetical protein